MSLPVTSRNSKDKDVAMIGGEGDRVSNWTSSVVLGKRMKKRVLVDGVLEGALGSALDLGKKWKALGRHECVWLLIRSEGDGELVLCIWRILWEEICLKME
ncbi:hypothetical protein Tco_0832822 [Tanacetum coccineum]